MIEQASLVIGEGNWAVKSDSLLGYKINGGKYYPREMDVVRATTGTRINEDGLVELVPYNLFTYSEAFSNVSWPTNGATFSVDTLTGNAGALFKGIFQNQTTQGVQSVFFDVAYSSHQWVQIAVGVGTGGTDFGYVNFDIQNKVVGAQTGGFTGSIVDFGTYVRIIANINTIAKTNVFLCLVNSSSSSRASSTTSTGSIKLYRSQLVEGSSALDYLPTTDRLDIARIDYSSGSGALLVEPQRTNLLTYSSSFDNAAWSVQDNVSVTANVAIAPDGTMTADKLVENSANTQHRIYRPINGTSQTISVFAKANGRNYIGLFSNAGTRTYFNLSDGTIGTVSIGSTATIEDYGNGWYRCTLYNAHISFGAMIQLSDNGINDSYLGDGTSGVFIWGAQLEAGSYPTSYIPTQGSTVTRNADVISKTGIADLIGQTEGTLFLDYLYTELDINGNIPITIGLDAASHAYIYFRNNGVIRCDFIVGAVAQGRIDTPSSYAVKGTRYKIAFAYKANDFAAYINGQLIGTDNIGSITGLSDLFFNYPYNSGFNATSNINATALYKTRLTNAELATLTTI